MQKDLRSFIELIASEGHLLIVEKQVDPKFEIPAVMKAAEKTGKAILFKNVSKPGFSIINNLLGDRKMLALLFETSQERVVTEWLERVKNPVEPQIIGVGPVKEMIKKGKDVDLEALPIVTHCSKDAGPFVTAGMVIAKDPETGIRNVSINRMQLKGRDKLGIRMMPPQHLGVIHEKSEKLGKNLEVAVAIGSEQLGVSANPRWGIHDRLDNQPRPADGVLARDRTAIRSPASDWVCPAARTRPWLEKRTL